jgi:hypothetical protein
MGADHGGNHLLTRPRIAPVLTCRERGVRVKPSRAGSAALGAVVAWLALSGAQQPGDASSQSGAPKPSDCINKREYADVLEGMKRARVHKLIGTSGTRESLNRHAGRAVEIRLYDVCKSRYSTVSITFQQERGKPFRVTYKTAVWVD